MCYTTPPPTVSQTGRVFKHHKAKIREEIVSQNLLGLKSEARLEEFFFSFRNRGLLAACVQETWRTGKDTLENGGCLLFLSGLMEMKSNRGEQGVGIALSERGVAAWKEAGSVLHNWWQNNCYQTTTSRHKWEAGLHFPGLSLLPSWK